MTDEEAIRLILRDDQYYEESRDSVLPGDVILYHDPKTNEILHSGIVIHVPADERVVVPWVVSKWVIGVNTYTATITAHITVSASNTGVRAKMIDRLIQKIEASDVRFDLMLASTPRTLLLRMEENSVLREAKALLGDNPDLLPVFTNRAKALYTRPSTRGYLHPDDMALAAYIFLLGRTAETEVYRFIDQVVRDRKPEFRSSGIVADYVVRHASASTSEMLADPALEDATFTFLRYTRLRRSKLAAGVA